jgi:phosphatidylcholine synthase
LKTASTVVVRYESPPWRSHSTALALCLRATAWRSGAGIGTPFDQFMVAPLVGWSKRGEAVRVWLAWGVHLFTASGALLGAAALAAIANGAWTVALLAMLGALFIDAVDGAAARAVQVDRVVPSFDGRRLDDMVDYLNYVIVPMVFLMVAGLLPHAGVAAVPILASAYGFSQSDAKTPDGFFRGFPSYWNVVAIYAWLLGVSPAATTAWVLGLSVLVFVPWKYVYPSKLRRYRALTFWLAILGFAAVVAAVLDPDRERAALLAWLSLLFPVWYFWLSFRLGGLAHG